MEYSACTEIHFFLASISMSSNRNSSEGKRLWYIILHANLTLYNFIFIYHERIFFFSLFCVCHFYEYAMPVLATSSIKLKFNGIKFSYCLWNYFCQIVVGNGLELGINEGCLAYLWRNEKFSMNKKFFSSFVFVVNFVDEKNYFFGL